MFPAAADDGGAGGGDVVFLSSHIIGLLVLITGPMGPVDGFYFGFWHIHHVMGSQQQLNPVSIISSSYRDDQKHTCIKRTRDSCATEAACFPYKNIFILIVCMLTILFPLYSSIDIKAFGLFFFFFYINIYFPYFLQCSFSSVFYSIFFASNVSI